MPIDTFIAPICDQQIELLYQDDDIVLINKPSGLLSLSGKNPLNLDSVHHRLAAIFPGITLTHRLDFGTSGIMLLARHKSANAHLTKQFQARTVVKHYESILLGHVKQEYGVIDHPISKDKALFPRLKICVEHGQKAETQFEVLEQITNPNRTQVKFLPHTGRTHQLRIHSQAINHPILGCDLYGTADSQSLSPRLLLHASFLEFNHPVDQQTISISCTCPF